MLKSTNEKKHHKKWNCKTYMGWAIQLMTSTPQPPMGRRQALELWALSNPGPQSD